MLAAMIFAEREFVIVGGPNGSGKTTTARRVAAACEGLYIGADAIAAEMNPADPLSVRIAASKGFVHRIRAELPGDRRLVVETTLSGRTFTRTVSRARAAGRPVVILFTYLQSVEQCIRRIAERVRAGGHHVPDEDVRRRYGRSLRNFTRHYGPASDRWALIDNAGSGSMIVAMKRDTQLELIDERRFNAFARRAEAVDDARGA
jgi:predicted ABC-type ATPase